MQTIIPTKLIGPFKINGDYVKLDEALYVPLATFETPLWYSVSRGAKVSVASSGIVTKITNNVMTRSILLEAMDLQTAVLFSDKILEEEADEIKKIAESTSRFLQFKGFSSKVIGTNIFIRIEVFIC